MPNRHRAWTRFVALTTLFLTVASFPIYAAPTTRPNILWLVSEDNDPFLGCYGDHFAKTPNLDKLASEGVRYTHAFANAPVCAPSRSTLITGIYASSLGTLHMRSRYDIPADVRYYCQYLRDAGYYCMNPGKTDYNIARDDKAPWDKGASWTDAPAGKPWMLVLNNATTHESCLHESIVHDDFLKEPFTLPPYHPDTPAIRSNWVEYYHDMTRMDEQLGVILKKLDAAGLADDTIVFYYSDHGGILPRSKRFLYDSGLHVPFIVRFGKNVASLAPAPPGSALDRLVSFIDLPPTILSLAGANIPTQFQGLCFMGPHQAEPRKYVFGFRGRMDERYDLSYTVRDARFRYIRNYMPHRIYGAHLDYLWKMPATVSWEAEYRAGRCNETQSAFWRPKPPEELFDENADPYEVHNLAADPASLETLTRLRKALDDQLTQNRDPGFLPESQMIQRAAGSNIFTATRDDVHYAFAKIKAAADAAIDIANPDSTAICAANLADSDDAVRYWAAVAFCIRAQSHAPIPDAAQAALHALLKDKSPSVRIAAAEAQCLLSHPDMALPILVDSIDATADGLLALNTLEALGDLANPAAESIRAKIRQLQDNAPNLPENQKEFGRHTLVAANQLLTHLKSQ